MIGRLAYAALFSALLPLLLIAWGARLDQLLTLPRYGTPALGWSIAIAGIALMLAATRSLWVFGGGLPASPFPPARFVTRGVYGVIAHPIYLGAVLAAAGVSLATRSGGGLWIVTPTLALAICAWVIGFERDLTLDHFGPQPAPLISLPDPSDTSPGIGHRAAFLVLVVIPWTIAFMAIEMLGVPSDVRSTVTRWDRSLPVIPSSEAVYASTYALVVLAPFVVKTRRELYRVAMDGLWATILILPLYLALPWIAEAKPVVGDGFWESALRFERSVDQPVTAMPAFHVVWAAIGAAAWMRRWPRLRWPLVALVVATAVSCVTTGMHSVADVVAGLAAYFAVRNRSALWLALCTLTERVANSWREWHVGGVRLLSHGVYAAVGIGLATAVAVALAGPDQLWWLVIMSLTALAGAALWAQLIEGSPQLLRPYGYFGSVVAAGMYAVVISVLGGDGWPLLAALTVGSAFGQPIGRLRCLIQGCCHGREAHGVPGIHYRHPQSRVVRLGALGGVTLHPTPLYSAAWTLVVALLLLRLWMIHAPLSFIVGAYLILIGAGRFVEEHFRGEPQTRVIGGLRLYQWLAIAMMVLGAVFTSVASSPAPASSALTSDAWLPLAVLTIICYLAYGVDFPQSKIRFSRLT